MTKNFVEEFNERPHYEDDMLSFQGSDDENGKVCADFNEDGDVKNLQLDLGMKFYDPHCFREALRAWAIGRGYSYKLCKNNRTMITTVCKNSSGWNASIIQKSVSRECGAHVHM